MGHGNKGVINGPGAGLKQFIASFLRDMGLPAEELKIDSIPGDGSKRNFWRIMPSGSDTTSYIAMENAPTDAFSRRENRAYLMIGKHLFEKGLPLPEIHRFDPANGWFIMEDMGDTSLQDVASHQKNRVPLYERVIEILFRLQTEGFKGFDRTWTCQTETYDLVVMRRYEADYFRDSFLCNYLGLKRDWSELESPFTHLAETASGADNRFFLHRDFQSRNILVSDDRIGILDWQGGRLGPLAYDLASLIIDPYTELSAHEKDQIFQNYLELLRTNQSGWVDPFQKYFPYLAIQRNLQILGAFSYLSKVRKKAYFKDYIPPALKSLHGLLVELKDPKLLPLTNLVESLL